MLSGQKRVHKTKSMLVEFPKEEQIYFISGFLDMFQKVS